MKSSRVLDLLLHISGYGVAAAALIVVVRLSRPSRLHALPTVGSSSWLGSYWAGLTFRTNAIDITQEGYEKHKSAPFKVAELYRWLVILGSREHVEELRRAPDDVLSFREATDDLLQIEYTMGPQVQSNLYHVPIVRSTLTRNIGALYPDIRDEIITAFDDTLQLMGNEWKSTRVLEMVQKVVCRTSNRVFVGLPLCRDPNWMELNIQYTIDVSKEASIIKRFPVLLRPLAARFLTNIHEGKQRARRFLGPIIEERQQHMNEYGQNWVGKPNDFLSWLMEEAEGPESTVEFLTTRILVLNFSAIHTTANSFTHVLLYLAANPQYIKPLREEVEAIVENDGWTKAALGRMRKVDSFLRECQRLEGISSSGVKRMALKDFTFSDGTFVPKGTMILLAIRSMHYDETIYEDAGTFRPFRFADLREEDGEGLKHQFTSTKAEYLAFGHGRHACPGRFFAASEMKTMLAHIVMTYDVKLEDNATRPPSLHVGTGIIPNPMAKVMFRWRVD